jgi:DNA-directed RNA polymerase III subunit RPC3
MSFGRFSKAQNTELYLYSGIIESYLGKRASVVASALINYGRLNIKELVKKTGLQAVVVKKTLVSLIQLNCICTWEEKNHRSETTYYYFREEGALLMLYAGEILAHIDEVYHNDSLNQIVQNFLSLGNLTVSDYLTSFGSQDAETTDSLEKNFITLVQDRFLVPVQKIHFNPLKDLWLKTYKTAYLRVPSGASVSELKRTAEAKAIAKLDFLNLLNIEPESLYVKDKSTSLMKVNPNISFAFNFKRFLKSQRSVQLTQLCSHRVGKVTSQIYRRALLFTEKNSPEVVDPLIQIGLTHEEILSTQEYEPKTTNMFTAKDVMRGLDVSLSATILAGPTKRKSNTSSKINNKRVKLEDGSYGIPDLDVDDDDDHDDDDDDGDDDEDMGGLMNNASDLTTVDQHLKILANSAIPFLKKFKNGMYYVPYPELMVHLKRVVSDSIVSSTLGAPSARILRCVRSNRLASEKLISSTALLREKDARSLTSMLVKHNLLQIQEVPKSADRAASKSVFLFRVTDKHSNDTMKTNLSWNMGQIVEKIALLRLENSALISKINRDDVKGKELEYLLPSELTQLKQMNEKELLLSTKLHRLISMWEVFKFN